MNRDEIKKEVLSCCKNNKALKLSGKNKTGIDYLVEATEYDLQDCIQFHTHNPTPEWKDTKLEELINAIEKNIMSGGKHNLTLVGSSSFKFS